MRFGEADMASFEKDLFISYAHIDNQPLTPEQKGWITRFHATLEALLSMRMGRRGEDLARREAARQRCFCDEIVAQFAQTAVLVSVADAPLSQFGLVHQGGPRILSQARKQTGGMVVDNKARVFKVIKSAS